MYIKQIRIQGFKSYKNLVEIDPFSPRFNVVVGRNGSGKSNFFAAVRFVLSDAYNHLNKEERAALIHEGSGMSGTTMSAFVEIIFDNSDRRLPTGGETVTIRRTIGSKKDEYSLDKKSSTRSEIMNLLESAGFSRANPYYIVPQGRITALTNAKNETRLALLKEVAGTKVYEQRRSESEKLMIENENKILKINSALDDINTRLSDLEEEKQELNEFLQLDKRRKCLDFALQDRELKAVETALVELQDMDDGGASDRAARLAKIEEQDLVISEVEAEIETSSRAREHADLAASHARDDVAQLRRLKASLEVELAETNRIHGTLQHEELSREKQLQRVQGEIESKESSLRATVSERDALKSQLEAANRALREASATKDSLLSREGRSAQFTSKAARDKWLQRQIAEISEFLESRKQALAKGKRSVEECEREITAKDAAIVEQRQAFADCESRYSELKRSHAASQQAREGIADEKKALWRQESYLLKDSDQLEQQVEKAQRAFASTMDRNTSLGLANLKRVAQKLGLEDQVYGPLCELIKLDDKYKRAVEVTAGNSLFHVVVEDDDVASKVIEQLLREKCGRLTFMPLNRLNPERRKYPEAENVFPLVDKISCNPEYEPAVQQVFGKTIVCINLQVGAAVQRNHNLNAITLGGDRVDAKGVLTGGFHDPKKSRLDAARDVQEAQEELSQIRVQINAIKNSVDEVEHRLSECHTEQNKLLMEMQQIEETRQRASESIKAETAAITTLKGLIEKKRDNSETLLRDISSMESQLESYNSELVSEFSSQLSSAQQQELERVCETLPGLSASVAELQQKVSALEMTRLSLENELQQNLYLSRDDMELQHNGDFDAAELAEKAATLTRKLVQMEEQLSEAASKQLSAEKALETAEQQVANDEAHLAELKDEQAQSLRKLSKFAKAAERVAAKRQALEQRREHVQAKIREIGILPDDAFLDVSAQSDGDMMQEFREVSDELKKFGHVNRKALEQFATFSKDRDRLLSRRQNLMESAESIEELISTLNDQKDRAIKRTFQQVSKEFSEVFQQLVPRGKGQLVIERRALDDQNPDSYTGVAINVSFNSTENEQQRVEQLSGGQKSLCALALIFAIQRSDPAPFYLFDEIDANLDDQYRTAVAQVISQIANAPQPTQFICTTFRNEMIHVADKFYGVLFNNKISTVKSITREDALTFVDGQKA
ncbi:YALIA101S10e00650g1_1 [Yarrowia lipolytica]|nr:Structural maintenance of chromosomes protein 3 [Yarrowia lipolytica]SEI36100.1 YALIA101S10e00650g1_1 [Yarrowia lipolytica]